MNWEDLKKVLEKLVYNKGSVTEFELHLLTAFVFGVLRQRHSHLSHFTFKTKVLHFSLGFFCSDCNNHWNAERMLLFLDYLVYCKVGLAYTLNVLECNCNFYALHYELSHIMVSGHMPLNTMELVWPRSSAGLDPKSQYLHGRPLGATGFQLDVRGGKNHSEDNQTLEMATQRGCGPFPCKLSKPNWRKPWATRSTFSAEPAFSRTLSWITC